jgi:hypothetical protein
LDQSRAYANSDFIADGNSYYPLWQSMAATFRAQHSETSRLNLAYGPAARQQFDLFLPSAPPKGLMVFVHGGYWMACGREDYSHLAAGAVALGWACALPSYTLAPAARVGEMSREIVQAIGTAAALVAGPVVVTGHSAGGHLSARMACADIGGTVAARVQRIVPISPLSDLAPLMDTDMNTTLDLTVEEVAAESPAFLAKRPGCDVHVWVGGQERPSFLWQARTLSEEWNCPWTVDPGRHHFDVIDGLTDPHSALMTACLGGVFAP